MDKKIKILIIAAAVLVVGGVIGGISIYQGEKSTGIPQIKIDTFSYDFGEVAMSKGLAVHSFNIKNEGDGDLKIFNISTSCMCTTAVLKVAGKSSPEFGMHNSLAYWSKKLKPQETAELEVTFDPLAHGPEATGPITRRVTLYSDDGGEENVKSVLTISANVVK